MKLSEVTSEIAVLYGVSERQVRRWQAVSAPVFSARGMCNFLAGQRNPGQAFLRLDVVVHRPVAHKKFQRELTRLEKLFHKVTQ